MYYITRMYFYFQGRTEKEPYPTWVMAIAGLMITAGVLPIPLVFLLRRFQCLKLDLDIHQGAIRRIDTTVSTKEMMGDVDVSYYFNLVLLRMFSLSQKINLGNNNYLYFRNKNSLCAVHGA